MKLPRVSTVVSVVLYAASLGLIGWGGWSIGRGDWGGIGFALPGALIWADLMLASRKAATPQRKA